MLTRFSVGLPLVVARAIAVPAALALFTAALYLPRLDTAQADLRRDEVFHAVSAHAIATSGRDLDGQRLPFIVAPRPDMFGFQTGAPPVLVYAMAAAFKVLPFSEASARVPIVIFGVIDVLLVYAIGRLWFASPAYAAIAAVLTAVSPAHMMFARWALTMQAPVPFVLGWLLSMLMYVRGRNPRFLFVGGVFLVVACAAYFGVLLLVPVYAALMAAALWRERAPARHYVVAAAGLLAPMLVIVPWLLGESSEIRRILSHYDWTDPRRATAIQDAAGLYFGFWHPRFLFVDGAPRQEYSTRLAGVVLVPLAGLAVAGLVTAARRFSTPSMLVVGSLLCAPVPASVVGERQAIWRGLDLVPLLALVAVQGLGQVCAAEGDRARRAMLVAVLGAVIALAVTYHPYLYQSQAILRAALVPLIVVALATLPPGPIPARSQALRSAALAIGVLIVVQVALWFAGVVAVIWSSAVTVALLALAMLIPDDWVRRLRLDAAGGGILLAIVCGEFVMFQIERASIPFVPAGARLPLVRFAVGAAAVLAGLAWSRHDVDPRTDRTADRRIAIALAILAAVQIAYFHVDYFIDDRLRPLHAALVLLATVGVVMLLRGRLSDRSWFAMTATAATLTIASIQFAYFYVDYVTAYQQRLPGGTEEVRAVLERTIARVDAGTAPAVCFWRVGDPGLYGMYWSFYLLKHQREDLARRTEHLDATGPPRTDSIRRLPPGSLIVTRGSGDYDRAVAALVDTGAVRNPEIVRLHDGTPGWWILERGAP